MSEVGQRLTQSATEALRFVYFAICRDEYTDTFNAVQGLKDNSFYSQAQLDSACAEEAYIQMHNSMPEWAIVVESFEVVEDNYIFVFIDPRKIN